MAHVIIDGYNVIRNIQRFRNAEAESLEEGRHALLFELEEYGAVTGYEILVVFDGAGAPILETGELPNLESFAGVDVLFSRRGKCADSEILRQIEKKKEFFSSNGTCSDIVVITRDNPLKDEAVKRGAFTLPPEKLDDAMRLKIMLSY